MLSLLIRLAGLASFATGIIALIADGIRSIAADHVVMSSLTQNWTALDTASYATAGQVVSAHAGDAIWQWLEATVLTWPTFAVAGGLGIVLMLVGARSRRTR